MFRKLLLQLLSAFVLALCSATAPAATPLDPMVVMFHKWQMRDAPAIVEKVAALEHRHVQFCIAFDLYTSQESPTPSREQFRIKLKGLSRLARQHGEIAALTEAGNRGLPAEDDSRQPCIEWFNHYLFSWIADPEIDVAFVLVLRRTPEIGPGAKL